MSAGALDGFRIWVTADGAGDEELALLVGRGAECVHGPVIVDDGSARRPPPTTAATERLIREVIGRHIDAVTFTSEHAVAGLLRCAQRIDALAALVDALAAVDVFCVDAVCASGFAAHPEVAVHVPDRPSPAAMVDRIVALLPGRSSVLQLAGTRVRLQGRRVVIGEDTSSTIVTSLSDRERAVLDVLLERPGVVHSKRDLLRRVWPGTDHGEHLVEVTVARLRQRLGPASDGIETVVRRGYRIAPSVTEGV